MCIGGEIAMWTGKNGVKENYDNESKTKNQSKNEWEQGIEQSIGLVCGTDWETKSEQPFGEDREERPKSSKQGEKNEK